MSKFRYKLLTCIFDYDKKSGERVYLIVMNRILFFLILMVFGPLHVWGQTTILRHYDPSSSDFVYPLQYQKMVARFELPAPVVVEQIGVWLTGKVGSKIQVTMYNHEGGTAFPQFEHELFTPIELSKKQDGKEYVILDLENPINFNNNQCFVVVTGLKGDIKLYSDSRIREATCSSSSGGDYYFQYQKNNSQWGIGIRRAFAIDLIVREFAPKVSKFTDVTHEIGIDTNLGNATMAWGDWNLDNHLDLIVSGHLYTATSSESSIHFEDQTESKGLPGSAKANAFVDLDNDGDLDIYLVDGLGKSFLYEQAESGNYKVHELNIPTVTRISSFSFGDFDKDKLPDLFIGQLWDAYPVPMPNYLLRNLGNFEFEDVSNLIYPDHSGAHNFSNGIACDPSNQSTYLSNRNKNRRSRGSEWIDIDKDNDLDLYVTNYFLELDELYRNRGNGTFEAIHQSSMIDKNRTGSNHGTGVDWADYDNDGDPDLLLPQFAHPAFHTQYDHRATTIYDNNGDAIFSDTYPSNGIQFEETYAGGTWGDVNNDGLLDFYITVFYGCRYVKVYLQKEDHTFELRTFDYGLEKLNTGQDAIWVDFNNDGKLDLCSGKSGRVRIFQNGDAEAGNYVAFDVSSTDNKFGIGTKISITTPDNITQTRFLSQGRGTRMQDPNRLHFGIGNNDVIEKVEITWPNGQTQKAFGLLVSPTSDNYHLFTWNQGSDLKGAIIQDVDNPPSDEPTLMILPNPGTAEQIKFLVYYDQAFKFDIINDLGQVIEELSYNESDFSDKTLQILYPERQLDNGTYILRGINKKSNEILVSKTFIISNI